MDPCDGDGGGNWVVVVGDSTLVGDSMLDGSRDPSGGACANSRDKDEGRAGGDEFDLLRTGNRCEVGG